VRDPSPFWSSTDFPYTCLRDQPRTSALGAVIAATVRPGDVVLDAGAGTGILSLYAARAGAGRVHAVENDPVLCRYLRETVHRNGYDDVIEVLEADIRDFTAPAVDVALIEMVETALVEESLVSAYNALLATGTLGPRTRCLPGAYTTVAQPVLTDDRFGDFEVVALRHDWSFYDRDPGLWTPSRWQAAGEPRVIWSATFAGTPVPVEVAVELAVPDQRANGLRLTGELGMPDGSTSTEFASLNGPKIVPLPPRPAGAELLAVEYLLSGGFANFTMAWRSGR
jgi:SAM-dependent methyltransferase